ncbi:hypothetical protein TSH7_15800 [Azospirillum sp. TSH7]|nr:hypothetical protein TSH7_15800 [Azospirillum sp. TSH7]PWC68590.1 hypothetical protein TSH20_10295 [Azospirillum sp. TSH20]
MVINDLHLVDAVLAPDEADTPLVVDADAMLPSSISSERFQSVPRWRTQILQHCRSVQHVQSPNSDFGDGTELTDGFAVIQRLGSPITETAYHSNTI